MCVGMRVLHGLQHRHGPLGILTAPIQQRHQSDLIGWEGQGGGGQGQGPVVGHGGVRGEGEKVHGQGGGQDHTGSTGEGGVREGEGEGEGGGEEGWEVKRKAAGKGY